MNFLALVLVILITLLFAYYLKALDIGGLVSGVLLLLIVSFTTSLNWFILLFLFFIGGVIATNISHIYVKRKDSKTRGWKNVVANGGVAAVAAVTGNFPAFLGSISAVAADTMSGEAGELYPNPPVLITDGRHVPAGTDGGVTPLGEIVGVLSALFLGLVAVYLGLAGPEALRMAAVAGFVGTNFDSLLGATLERKGFLDKHSVNFLAALAGAVTALLF